jgi:hypothetical protein
MYRRLADCFVLTAAVFALVCAASVNTGAQQRNKEGASAKGAASREAAAKPLPPGGPAPRLSDGHPDFSGIWFSGTLGTESATLVGSFGNSDPSVRAVDPKAAPEEKPSFTPFGLQKMKETMFGLDSSILKKYGITYSGATSPGAENFDKLPKDQQKAFLDVEIARVGRGCIPSGVPEIGGGGAHGMQFIHTPGQLVQLVEVDHDFRVIPTDGRPHTQNPNPSFNGESRAHWEGDTLVVDTIAIDERVWNGATWRFHSEQEHVIERYSRPSKNYLVYQYTVEDPKVLTKSWVSAPRRLSLSVTNEPLDEWYCGVQPNEALESLKELRKELE